MSELSNEKAAAISAGSAGTDTPPPEVVHHDEDILPRGKPWMYKRLKIGPWHIPAYASPEFQIVFVAVVCFLCPGMFNAISGLGAAGFVDPHDINNANTALYAFFAGVGFFAGSIANKIGLRITLGIGGFGYTLWVAALLVYKHSQNVGFLIFSGALLGLCAGMLWTAQGAIMMAYPPEQSKGRYIATFWMIFNLGAVIGGLIPLAQNIHSKANAVNDGTYIAFIVLMALGFGLATCLCDPRLVQRADGSHIILMKNPTWKSEIWGLVETLRDDWYLLGLFPMFFASNWFYTYHFQDVNAAKFNIRTRALNSVLYYTAQIIGAWIFGFLLDTTRFTRRTRAKIAIGALFVLTFVIWGGGYNWQTQYTREEVTADGYVKLDWSDSGYIGPMFLYIFYGMFDSVWQTTSYWLMGSLSNNGRKLANFTGFYKSIQSAGSAISPVLDTKHVSFMTQFAVNWGLLAGSLIIASPVIWFKVKDTTDLEEDLKFSDETKEDILGGPTDPAIRGTSMISEKI